MVNKFRAGKIKREHSIVSSIVPLLERLEQCPDVQAIIPAEIAHNPSPSQPTLTFQRFTDQGLRLLGKGEGAVQEVYVVTANREAVLAFMREAGWLPRERPAKTRTRAVSAETVRLQEDEACAVCGNLMRAGTTVAAQGSGRNQRRMHRWCSRRLDAAPDRPPRGGRR
ncbi:MAG: DUF2103 domain-containing protein [Bacillota bacterium]